MSTTVQRPPARAVTPPPVQPPSTGGRGRASDKQGLRSSWNRWRRVHGRAPLYLLPTLVIAGVVQAWNMTGSPQRIDDEGTYVAQAWAILNMGELAHYTYWYDHPPLGWIQLAGYAQLTGAFERWDVAVMAGREAVLVATVIATALLWLLGRKVGLSRAFATLAALLFALSPLALQFHRTVYLDNIATPWLLGALIFAMSRKHQLAGFVASAMMFGFAVLTKETYLLALPLLVFVMYRSAWPATRRYTMSVAGTMLFLVGAGYILFAAVKGELVPGENRVSLFEGIAFQLASRASSGSLGDPESQITRTLAQWWQLDPSTIIAGLVAAIAALFIRRLRPYAVLLLALVAFMFRPGSYLPVPYIIMLLPFAALLIAGVIAWGVHKALTGRRLSRVAGVGLTAVAVTGAVVAAPLWESQLGGFQSLQFDRPAVQAQEWVEQNVERTDRLIVDDAMWVDLVSAGFEPDNVIWYYKLDTDLDVMEASPNGWQDSDYIITTDSMRTFPELYPQVNEALNNSEVVASFGTGAQEVDVRRIYPEGPDARNEDLAREVADRAAIGFQLAANPALDLTAESVSQLSAGQVDARVIVALVQSASRADVAASFPSMSGEDGTLRRQLLISELDGVQLVPGSPEATAVEDRFEGMEGIYAPSDVEQTQDGVLATFSLDQPAGVLPG